MRVAEPEEAEGEGEEALCGDHGAGGGWSGADGEGAFPALLVFAEVAEVVEEGSGLSPGGHQVGPEVGDVGSVRGWG